MVSRQVSNVPEKGRFQLDQRFFFFDLFTSSVVVSVLSSSFPRTISFIFVRKTKTYLKEKMRINQSIVNCFLTTSIHDKELVR